MIENPLTRALQPFDFSHLIDNVPKIKLLDHEIDNIQFNPPIDSSDMSPEHWQKIAADIKDNYDNYDGFVVLHGTDTMAYTASALSFMLQGLKKPVIITGSQLPIGEVRTDGEENLITALQIAAARGDDGQPMVQEVAILFENYLWRGNRATKFSADDFNAFKSTNYPPLAHIGLTIDYNRDALYRPEHKQLKLYEGLDSNVMFIKIFPGMTRELFSHLLHTPNIKGVVLRTFGAGNTPTAQWFMDEIADAIRRGIVLVSVTQCASGGVLPNRYVSADCLTRLGVIPGMDMTSEAAITKLMHLFGQNLTFDEVTKAMKTPVSGEISPQNV